MGPTCDNSQTMRAIRGVLIVAALIAATGVAPVPAHATASYGVEGTIVWKATESGTDYTFREVAIAPGGSTGWHWHNGRLYGLIEQGTLTHNMADCSIDGIYSAGEGTLHPALGQPAGGGGTRPGLRVRVRRVEIDVCS